MLIASTVVKKACTVLKSGGVILYPTDTIWGLGCDARHKEAVKKIIHIKQRKTHKGFILLAEDYQMIKQQHPQIVNATFFKKMQQQKRPCTIIYPYFQYCTHEVQHKDGSVAIRVVEDLFCKSLIACLGFPIVSTSANVSGKPFPHKFKDIAREIIHQVDYSIPSTVQLTKSPKNKPPEPSTMFQIDIDNGNWIRIR